MHVIIAKVSFLLVFLSYFTKLVQNRWSGPSTPGFSRIFEVEIHKND